MDDEDIPQESQVEKWNRSNSMEHQTITKKAPIEIRK